MYICSLLNLRKYFPMIPVPGSTYFSTLQQYVSRAFTRAISLQEAERFLFSLVPTPHKFKLRQDPCLEISVIQVTSFSTVVSAV